MEIALYHKHYDEQHLAEVKQEMVKRGAPVLRGIWSEVYGMWMAVEGCHRIRAAKELGLTPTMKDIGGQKYTTMQIDGENVKVKVSDLAEELTSTAWKAEIVSFGE